MVSLRSHRITPDQAMGKIRALLAAHAAGIVGFDRRAWDDDQERGALWHKTFCSMRFRRGDEDVTLSASLDRNWVDFRPDAPSVEGIKGCLWEVQVEVGWSATRRSPARAASAAAFYAQVSLLALQVQTEMEREQVAQTNEEIKAVADAEEAAERRAHRHVAGLSPAATLCGLARVDLEGGLLGVVLPPQQGYVGSETTCPGCLRVLKFRDEEAQKKAQRAAKSGKPVLGTWVVWSSLEKDGERLFVGPYDEAVRYARSPGVDLGLSRVIRDDGLATAVAGTVSL